MSKDPRDIIIKPVVSEKSYAGYDLNVYTFVVAAERQQDRDPQRGRAAVRAPGREGSHDQPQGQALA